MNFISHRLGIATTLVILLSGCVTVTNGEPQNNADPIAMAESRISLGLGYLENRNMVKARENLELAVRHSPNYYRSHLSMAHYYEVVSENEKARQSYNTALRHNSKNGNVLNNYGTFLCKQGEFKQADHYFQKAIQQPYYYLVSASYENAGFCALKAGHNDKALSYFERALDHDPNRVRSTLQLAKLEVDNSQYNDARLRLLRFHKRYGYQVTSLKILITLESGAGNQVLERKYREQLQKMQG